MYTNIVDSKAIIPIKLSMYKHDLWYIFCIFYPSYKTQFIVVVIIPDKIYGVFIFRIEGKCRPITLKHLLVIRRIPSHRVVIKMLFPDIDRS